MSQFLYHEPCPQCNSRDNLGVWDDGHKFCFGCGYTEGGKKSLNYYIENYHLKNQNNNNKDIKDVIGLPLDYTTDLPDVVKTWLDNYGLTDAEVYRYKLGWSDEMERLIFPVYVEDTLVFWQGRSFNMSNPLYSGPKHITRGKSSDILHILGDNMLDTVICCEDMISAIKIARIRPAWCLFGSNLSTEALERASRLFRRLGVWLDRDKAEYALKTVLRASVFFDEVFPIITEKDPKWYSTKQLQNYIAQTD